MHWTAAPLIRQPSTVLRQLLVCRPTVSSCERSWSGTWPPPARGSWLGRACGWPLWGRPMQVDGACLQSVHAELLQPAACSSCFGVLGWWSGTMISRPACVAAEQQVGLTCCILLSAHAHQAFSFACPWPPCRQEQPAQRACRARSGDSFTPARHDARHCGGGARPGRLQGRCECSRCTVCALCLGMLGAWWVMLQVTVIVSRLVGRCCGLHSR